MADVTTIQIPPATRDRLRRFGLKGQTYAEILEALMARVEYEEFMDAQYARLAERADFVALDVVAGNDVEKPRPTGRGGLDDEA